MNILQNWWKLATADERQELAELAGSTIPSLRQSMMAYRTCGELALTAEFALRLMKASSVVKLKSQHDQPLPLDIRGLCQACAVCPHAQTHM